MKRLLIALIAVAIGAGTVLGHDVKGHVRTELNGPSRQIAAALAATSPNDVATRSVLNNLSKWPVPYRLKICFVNGSKALRGRVTEAVQRLWPLGELSEGRLDYDRTSFEAIADCPPKDSPASVPRADISIDFTPGGGYWSYVGVVSTQFMPSMSLGGFTETDPAQQEFERLVAHEFGHAFGLEHEHQSPAAPVDCRWNYDYLKTFGWKDEAEMYRNFEQFQNTGSRKTFIFSTYDRMSVMHYSFEPQAYKEGSPCRAPVNTVPSSLDRMGIRLAYSAQAQRQQDLQRSSIPDIAKKFEKLVELRRVLYAKQVLLLK